MEGDSAALADALAAAARQQGEATPSVRGADWQTLPVTDVNSPPGTVTCGSIVARCLESYANPTVGELAIITRSGAGNWLALGRTASAVYGGWRTYTPTWTASTTNPTLGSGTLVGRYQKIGRTVHLHINLIAGSGSAGSGDYSFALPVQAANVGCTYVGTAHLLGASRWGGQFLISPNATAGAPFFPASTTNPRLDWMTATVPEAFGSGDQLRCTVTYEAAA